MRTTAVGLGAAAGVAALGSTSGSVSAFDIDWSDVGTIAATTVVGGPIGLGWALRETEVLGSDTPPEGLTASALEQDVYQTARTRKSTNASTIIDNQNIIDGVENNAYTEAKIAAIEKLNEGATESNVLDAASAVIDSYATTVKSNFLKTWNEAVRELYGMASTLRSHPDLNPDGIFSSPKPNDSTSSYIAELDTAQGTYTLPDGTEMDLLKVRFDRDASFGQRLSWNAIEVVQNDLGDKTTPEQHVNVNASGESLIYLDADVWHPVWSEMDTTFQNVRDGISTWVTSVYGDVQSGEIEISELITPRERAAMLSDDESEANAIADLTALNIPIDPERDVTITIPETGATLSGTIGLTDESDGPIESGETYDPSTFTGEAYLTADVSQISGTWDAYETGVDGGTITLTAQPYDGTVLNVTTTAGETVSVPASDWTDNGDGTYSYDASGDLETKITEVESAGYESEDDETQYETLNLSKEFTVESIVNRETGENTSSASFESNEPQTDSNYITQDEWDQLEQQNQELIEKFEESQSTGAAGGGFFEGQSPDVGLIAAGIGSLGVLYALFGQGDN